ncbi:glycosyl transferase family 1 [Tamilnaduibacter salinus]|uniref:tRNA-queuosine alpha-mannosyltransferase n=1 Tax=Tamilnaduibacter salinus TaxID=1484056 RepID=A0A2A2I7X8_9GAMM|nr:DUF3524 domain-containing protein [Tamilnaduibacter salinus]PAV27426.1 glycosyl transferase family 1 [Tamilnaduibacter salinus]
MSDRPRILLLSGYDAASHRRWREQLVASQPSFEWSSLALPARHFRWRIRGNALSWLEAPEFGESWDLILATSMVDLAGLRAFHPHLAQVPTLLYMHENQVAYPGSGRQHSSAEPVMVNLYSAVAADRVVFNSEWNRESFLAGTSRFLQRMPDRKPQTATERIRAKSDVLPVPISDGLFRERSQPVDRQTPHLLWNHRWEYDKGPDRLVSMLARLESLEQPYRLSVVGQQFRREPEAFAEIQSRFGQRLVHWGYVEDRADYDRLLVAADVVLSTALHDFQGLSMLEGMASGCLALAPDRLAYPEYVPETQRYPSLEDDPIREGEGAAEHLVRLLSAADAKAAPPEAWRLSRLAGRYTEIIHATRRRAVS